MKILNLAFVEQFFKKLNKVGRCLIMVDYDGTLAPFCIDRDKALPHPQLIQVLEMLRQHKQCEVVVISGRSINELKSLVSLRPLPQMWGSHGLEHLIENGEKKDFKLLPAIKSFFEKEYADLCQVLPDKSVEYKRYSIAVHWRGKSLAEIKHLKEMLKQRWQVNLEMTDVEMRPFNGGQELRLKGVGKGSAVKELLQKNNNLIPCVFFGDDLTDEDAFAALDGKGLKVLIKNHHETTLADIELDSIEELIKFLSEYFLTVSMAGENHA